MFIGLQKHTSSIAVTKKHLEPKAQELISQLRENNFLNWVPEKAQSSKLQLPKKKVPLEQKKHVCHGKGAGGTWTQL